MAVSNFLNSRVGVDYFEKLSIDLIPQATLFGAIDVVINSIPHTYNAKQNDFGRGGTKALRFKSQHVSQLVSVTGSHQHSLGGAPCAKRGCKQDR
jgi:hypothetical protein